MRPWPKFFSKIPLSLWQQKDSLARLGEKLACDYLKKQGYQILAERFRTRFGEIDVIAQKENTLSFVEVKTRQNSRFGTPLMAITPQKISRLLKASQIYRQSLNKKNLSYSVEFLGIGIQIEEKHSHLECVILGEDL